MVAVSLPQLDVRPVQVFGQSFRAPSRLRLGLRQHAGDKGDAVIEG